jgi:hypothetical protein
LLVAALSCFSLAGCGDDNLVAHPPPVVINVPLKLGQEVVCVEATSASGMPVVFPLLSYAEADVDMRSAHQAAAEHYK